MTKKPESLNVHQILKDHQIRPDKRLGQNFLIVDAYLEKIVAEAGILPSDTVLEIGPGLGSLTVHLCAAAARITAVELDQRFIPPLKEVTKDFSNFEVIQGDILLLEPHDLNLTDGYCVVANIPYYITSAVIKHLLTAQTKPRVLVLTIQKEVAKRITSKSGKLSLLALSVLVFGDPEYAFPIPAGAFYPQPKVDSAVIKVDILDEPRIPPSNLDAFFKLARAGFQQKRKNLRNSLSSGVQLEKSFVEELLAAAQIDKNRRAETLSMDEWIELTKVYLSQQNNNKN